MSYKDKLALRKEELKTAAEFSDEALNQLARAELADEVVSKITDICSNLDKLLKTSGSQRDWVTHPKYEYGTVNGNIAKFITNWIYLPDSLKEISGIKVPNSAFTSELLESWGRLPYCSNLGQLVEGEEPNLQSVQVQLEMVKAYLGLDYIDTLLTLEEWQKKANIARNKALKKQADIETAMLEDALEKDLGLPTFTV